MIDKTLFSPIAPLSRKTCCRREFFSLFTSIIVSCLSLANCRRRNTNSLAMFFGKRTSNVQEGIGESHVSHSPNYFPIECHIECSCCSFSPSRKRQQLCLFSLSPDRVFARSYLGHLDSSFDIIFPPTSQLITKLEQLLEVSRSSFASPFSHRYIIAGIVRLEWCWIHIVMQLVLINNPRELAACICRFLCVHASPRKFWQCDLFNVKNA